KLRNVAIPLWSNSMKFLSPVVLSSVMLTLNAGAAAQDKTRNYLALVVSQTEMRPNGFHSRPVSGRLEINIADVMLAQHGVERRQVFPHQLLKVLRRFVASLLQLFLHSGLLRGGRKIRTGIELAEQVKHFLQQHRCPAAVVLPAAGEF